ncbi:MAG: transcription termination factor NusA [Ardenticatenaceae bacterium]|nr:transcription termination factor NusA [Ardenticatenaceae bacterium]
MKSEFLLAFNEICQERGLPQEAVIEALKTALVSAYRRDIGVSNTQAVSVDIDPRTGEPTIYAEKEVVDSIVDDRTEVLMDDARRAGFNDAEYGDTIMYDSTPRNFGRIAAQTAKQVILQRVREAERDQLFDDFASREGEIVNGTVQSVSGGNITIGLGRTEAILPRSQQVSSERYRPHDKIRVYVLEVKRTNRGPQILVSRNHRNLLRRLLELEVPEIYNGQVDIKSIAREAGQRSKVAVVALQPGVDPVGACVGMRGVRIQSIVRELNDEKIDVIEWDNNQHNFIAKALSPARVSAVYLEEHPDEGKTAVVIVPDDQLSLAIGREGQNARLAAKLTGWRIDIKSLTEAASDSLDQLDNPAADPVLVKDLELHEQVRNVIAKKAAGRPVTAEDYRALERLVSGVEGRIISKRAAEFEQIRKDRAEVRKLIPAEAWETELEELDLLLRYHNVLIENNITTVGDALYQLQLGDDKVLALDGFGDKALESLKKKSKEYLVDYHRRQKELADQEPEEAVPADTPAAPVAEVDEAPAAEPVAEAVEVEAEVEEAVEAEVAEVAEVEAEAQVEAEAEEEDDDQISFEQALDELDERATESEGEFVDPLDDLNTSLADLPAEKPKKTRKKKKSVVIVKSAEEEAEEEMADADLKKKKGRVLVFDEDAGRVVAKRKRKRDQDDWESDEWDY